MSLLKTVPLFIFLFSCQSYNISKKSVPSDFISGVSLADIAIANKGKLSLKEVLLAKKSGKPFLFSGVWVDQVLVLRQDRSWEDLAFSLGISKEILMVINSIEIPKKGSSIFFMSGASYEVAPKKIAKVTDFTKVYAKKSNYENLDFFGRVPAVSSDKVVETNLK